MFSYCLYLILILSTDAHFLHSNENINKIINNKKDLINIINSLNRVNENLKSNNEEYKKSHTHDSTEELTDMEKEKKLQQILWLIKANYNAQKQYDLLQNPVHSGARLYLIRNPEAIDEYKNYLEQKKTKRLKEQNIKNKLQQLRRKTVFGNNEVVTLTQCRKYDVEQESRTLYGENLKSVIERFRRTPEYLTILSDEVDELRKKLDAVSDRTMYVFALKLYDRVVEELGVNHSLLRSRPEDIYHIPRSRKLARRPRVCRHGVKKLASNVLDSYNQFRNPLTLDERNRMKELGFQYCGLAIHAMLENISPDDALPASTLLPHGGYPHHKTTYHHKHEITQPTPSTEPETPTTHAHQHSTNLR